MKRSILVKNIRENITENKKSNDHRAKHTSYEVISQDSIESDRYICYYTTHSTKVNPKHKKGEKYK